MFSLVENKDMGVELRVAVVDSLIDLMKSDERVVALEADLGSASKWNDIEKYNKSKLINVGIAEANMVGVAAGLSSIGFIPYIHTFGPFATRRALDQIYMAGGYSKNTVNIYGSDPGFAAGHNGGTHTTFEDVALLRTIPNVTICDAADATQMRWIIKEFSSLEGIHYVRGNRKAVHNLYTESSNFELGKGNLLLKGEDYLIIAAGQLVYEALEVAKELENYGISCDVIDMFTIKPLDSKLILDRVKGKKLVITIENHSIIGGLGSAVSEVLTDSGVGLPLKRIGAKDVFGQVGTPEYLQKEYGLTTEKILKQII